MTTTWVLGGGGARGASQAGVLLGLFEVGVPPPDRIIGVSVGALNGATIARFPSLAGAQMLREIWTSRLVASVFRPRPVESLVNRLRGRAQLSLLSSAALLDLVERQLQLLGIDRFDQLKLPLEVGVTNLGDGAARVISDGRLLPALAASTAIPGLFPGVGIGEDVFFDGGVADNDPIGLAVEGGAEDVLAISLCGTAPGIARPRRWLDLLGQSVAIMLHRRMLADFA
ncbi:MAG: patatin-like phospholipase family protein, partial [Candidatus Dormiibacterota bacterium]